MKIEKMKGDRVYLELIIPEGWVREGNGRVTRKTEGGLILAGTEGQAFRKNKGVVLAVGNKVTDTKVGDKVIFEDWAPVLFSDDVKDDNHFWVHEEHIIAEMSDGV